VDDLRESPAVSVVQDLTNDDVGEIYLVEPNIEAIPKAFAGCKRLHWSSLTDAIAQSDIVALLVAHDQFRALDRTLMTDKVVIDAAGALR
jgi:UDP-N-acetyl-D-mannosaminuronic acid dehydrogenase